MFLFFLLATVIVGLGYYIGLPLWKAYADGTARTCDFGDNPLTPQPDVFACNNKLIGGAGFLNTYTAVVGPEKFGKTARDSDGHGTHTASTSAGNVVSSAKVFGVERGPMLHGGELRCSASTSHDLRVLPRGTEALRGVPAG